jgi:hypothetical protein
MLSTLLSFSNKKRLKWLVKCDYSHFFAPDWTHKITVKSYLHAQNQKVKRRAFRRPGLIPLQKVENGRISLQEVVDDCNLTRLFSPRFLRTDVSSSQ